MFGVMDAEGESGDMRSAFVRREGGGGGGDKRNEE